MTAVLLSASLMVDVNAGVGFGCRTSDLHAKTQTTCIFKGSLQLSSGIVSPDRSLPLRFISPPVAF